MIKSFYTTDNMIVANTTNLHYKEGGQIMATNNKTGRNQLVVPEARQALSQMKTEIANELGLTNYESTDKGNLTARQNGYVGGYMVKRLIETAERNLSGR